MTRKLISSAQAAKGKVQHTQPCSDCPMARSSLNGWLGGATPQEYVQLAHSDAVVDCHAIRKTQCAGMSIYRANVCKRRDPPQLQLPKDTSKVFATPMEFIAHHECPLRVGQRVEVEGHPATFRGLNPKVPGDYWIEFDFGGGWWSYHPSSVKPQP